MVQRKRAFVIVIGFLLMVMLFAACGSTSGSNGSTGTAATPAPTTAPTTAPTSAPTATSGSSNSAAVLQTATATVKGQSETILTDAHGKTLYYFTSDTAKSSACTGGCAQVWPALLNAGSNVPTSSASLPGKLTVLTDTNGSQVEYNGHLLYTYSGDSGSGQTNGEGLFGKWFVATPTLAAQSSSSSGGGYGTDYNQ